MITSQEERKNLKAKKDSHRCTKSNLQKLLVFFGQRFFFF